MFKRLWCRLFHKRAGKKKHANMLDMRMRRDVCLRCGAVHEYVVTSPDDLLNRLGRRIAR